MSSSSSLQGPESSHDGGHCVVVFTSLRNGVIRKCLRLQCCAVYKDTLQIRKTCSTERILRADKELEAKHDEDVGKSSRCKL